MRRDLDRLRQSLPPVPRPVDKLKLPAAPSWVEGDALHRIWERGRDVLRNGEPTVAWIMMANMALWEPGDEGAPASIVYSFDEALANSPDRLAPVAADLYRYHQGADDAVGPPLRPWARLTYDYEHTGFERHFYRRLPPEITGSRIVYHSAIYIFRESLPSGHLTDHALPIVVDRDDTGIAMVPPVVWWPTGLASRWGSRA
ncbi:MAG: hypothetical protein AAF602_18500 [Myxococcota bacterium]